MSLAARWLAVVVLVTLVTAVAAQTPARDRAAAETGTATISGIVVEADTGKPIGRANVYASVPGIGQQPRAVQSAADGRFVLTEVPAGKITLNATKVTYLSAVGPGSANPRQRVTPYELGPGQTLEKVVIVLSRGGVISGRIVDDHGDPLDGAQVRALRPMYSEGQRRLVQAFGGNIVTDDQGAFRLYGLPPGEVYIGVLPGRDFTMPPAASPEGPTYTFYPGTINQAEAKPIPVRLGRETGGIVFPIAFQRLARVQGRVLSASTEQFVNWHLNSYPVDTYATGRYGMGGGSIRADGTFELRNLPPGVYGLEARPQNWQQQNESELARTIVSVNGDDLTDVVISAARGGLARGRLVMDDGSVPPVAPNAIRLSSQPADPKSPFRNSGPPPIISKDWTFEMGGLLGPTRLTAATIVAAGNASPAWAFKAVARAGRDVTDSGIDFRAGEIVDGIQIVFTRKPTRLTGTLDPRANPAATWILIFSADESRWQVPSRFVHAVRALADSTYAVSLVPNHEYLIIAVDDIEDGQGSDPDLLRAVRLRAAKLTLADGESRSLNLAVVDWRQ